MWNILVSALQLSRKSGLGQLAQFLSECRSNSIEARGVLLFGPMTRVELQSIVDLLETTYGPSWNLSTVPLAISQAISVGDLTSLEEDENLPF